MPITNIEIKRFNADRYIAGYTFSSGEELERRSYGSGLSESDALIEAVSQESLIEADIQERDAERAEDSDGGIEAVGEATQKQVAIRYLKRAMSEDDSNIAFQKLDAFNTFRVNRGWTPAQVKAQLGLTDNQWAKITTRYTYLKTNQTLLTDYQTMIAGDVVRDD